MKEGYRQRDVVFGVVGGIVYAISFSAIALLLHVLSGGAALSEVGVTIPALILVYLVGGIVGGGLVGWLWPWTASRMGAVAVAVIGAHPVYIGAALLLNKPLLLSILAGSFTAVIVGTIVGVALWSPP